MNKAIFILGMHRSGTSALSRVVNLLGAELGGRMMAAASDNERGFWEHESAVQIHEELLIRLGHSWCDGTPLPEGWQETEAAKIAQTQLATLIDLDFLNAPLWAIKDPRLSLLFPLWVPLLKERNIAPLCIIAWRDPLEVAASLQKRDSMSQDAALLCWLAYTVASLQHALSFPSSIIRYADLLKDWRGAASRLGQDLGVEWPCMPEAEINAFLAPELRHHHLPKAKLPHSGIGQLVEQCLAVLENPEEAAIKAIYQQWQDYTLPLEPMLRQARIESMEYRERALNAEHRAADITGQMAKLYEEYGHALEREKEALVQSEMLRRALSHAETIVAEMKESTSWKVTEPLRKLKKWQEEH